MSFSLKFFLKVIIIFITFLTKYLMMAFFMYVNVNILFVFSVEQN